MTSTSSFKDTDPDIEVSNTGRASSFAYVTARERWPKILNQIINDLSKDSKSFDEDTLPAANEVKSKIASLKEDVANDVGLRLLEEDGADDIHDYNAELTVLNAELSSLGGALPGGCSWLHAPWLYTECYLYRLLHQYCALAIPPLETYDLFGITKHNSLVGSRRSTIELVKRFKNMRESLGQDKATVSS